MDHLLSKENALIKIWISIKKRKKSLNELLALILFSLEELLKPQIEDRFLKTR